MIWQRPDPDRLHPQEQALLSLCDRMTMVEQLLTLEVDEHRHTRRRLDRAEAALAQIVAILEWEE